MFENAPGKVMGCMFLVIWGVIIALSILVKLLVG